MDGPLGMSDCPSPSSGNALLFLPPPAAFLPHFPSRIWRNSFSGTLFWGMSGRALSRPRPQLTLDSLSTPQPRSAKKGVGRRAGREPSRESYFCAADKWRSRQIFLAPAPSLRLSVLLSSPFYTVCLPPFDLPLGGGIS